MSKTMLIPISQEIISEIEKIKKKDETIQDVINKILEEYLFQREVHLLQLEKMKELWDNEADGVWEKVD